MEVATLDKKNGIRIKSKNASFLVEPPIKGTKIPADAVFLFSTNQSFPIPSYIEGARLVVRGPGEYEVAGVKIIAIAMQNYLAYKIVADGMRVCVVPSEILKKELQEKLDECEMLLIRLHETVDASLIAPFAPREVVLFGEGAGNETAKLLGKEGIPTVAKVQTTLEKLPEEMEVVILG